MPVVWLQVEEGVEEPPRSLEVQLEQDVHAEAEELPLPPPVGWPQLLPHLGGERVPCQATHAVAGAGVEEPYDGVRHDRRGGKRARHHVARGRVHHPCRAADADNPLRQDGQRPSHGDDAALVLLDASDAYTQVPEARGHALLDVVHGEPRARDQGRLLEEDPGGGEGHGVEEGGDAAVALPDLRPFGEVRVAPVHEEHLVDVERVGVDLGEDAVGDLVPRVVRLVVLHEAAREARGVEHDACRDGDAVVTDEEGGGVVVDGLGDLGLVEDDAVGDAAVHHGGLELAARDAGVGAVERLGAAIVDEDGGGGPDGVEAVGEAHGLELVHPHAVVVGPHDRGGRVDGAHRQARLRDALRHSEARGPAAHHGEVHGAGARWVVAGQVERQQLRPRGRGQGPQRRGRRRPSHPRRGAAEYGRARRRRLAGMVVSAEEEGGSGHGAGLVEGGGNSSAAEPCNPEPEAVVIKIGRAHV